MRDPAVYGGPRPLRRIPNDRPRGPRHFGRIVSLGGSLAMVLFLSGGPLTTGTGANCSPHTSDLTAAFDVLEALLVERVRVDEIPGMAASVVCGHELIWAKGYGVLAVDNPQPVTPETRFRIASLTKLFTATAVMKLQEAGALDVNDAVRAHLPWFRIRRPPETGVTPVTIWHLLTHTAGMPRDSRLTDFSRLFQPEREDAIRALPAQMLESPPGERYAYSNLGYAILGEVITSASGMDYADYLAREVFAPLSMTTTLVHPTREDITAWGHGPRRPGAPRLKAGFWELRFATPAGGMASSVNELSEFVRLQLAQRPVTEPRFLSPTALRDMHRVQFLVDPELGGSGLAWGVDR